MDWVQFPRPPPCLAFLYQGGALWCPFTQQIPNQTGRHVTDMIFVSIEGNLTRTRIGSIGIVCLCVLGIRRGRMTSIKDLQSKNEAGGAHDVWKAHDVPTRKVGVPIQTRLAFATVSTFMRLKASLPSQQGKRNPKGKERKRVLHPYVSGQSLKPLSVETCGAQNAVWSFPSLCRFWYDHLRDRTSELPHLNLPTRHGFHRTK